MTRKREWPRETRGARAGRGGNAIWILEYAKCVLWAGAVMRGFLLALRAFLGHQLPNFCYESGTNSIFGGPSGFPGRDNLANVKVPRGLQYGLFNADYLISAMIYRCPDVTGR